MANVVKSWVLMIIVVAALAMGTLMTIAQPAEAGPTHAAVRYSAWLSECYYGGWSWYDYYYNGTYYWYWC